MWRRLEFGLFPFLPYFRDTLSFYFQNLVMKNYRSFISINPNIRFGKPCIKGTRISVGDILGWLAAGMNNEEIIEDFPELSIEAIRAALAFAADREESTKILAAA